MCAALLLCLTALVITENCQDRNALVPYFKHVAGFGRLSLQSKPLIQLIPCMLNCPGLVRSADSI